MQKITILSVLCITALLSACAFFHPYQPDVQQGNLIATPMLKQVKLGMSKDQVLTILGHPLLENTFNEDHWAYVYTFQHNGEEITKKQLDLYFDNNHLVKVTPLNL